MHRALIGRTMSIHWPPMDCREANRHQMVVEHMYRRDFALIRSVSVMSRLRIDMAYCDRWDGF